MKGFLLNLLKGLAIGLGFSIGVISVVFFWDKSGLWDRTQSAVGTLKTDELSSIQVSDNSIAVKDGRIIVTADVRNEFPRALKYIGVQALIFENDQPIEKCNGQTNEVTYSRGEQRVLILCQQRWESLDEGNLRVELTIPRAWLDDGSG